MARVIIISADELMAMIESTLRPYIGLVAEVADHRPMLESVLDQYFYGYPVSTGKSLNEMIREYSVPSDVVSEIVERVSNQLIDHINRAFGRIYPAKRYQYRFTYGDAVVIEEIEVVIGFDWRSLEEDREKPSDIQAGLERGDWYPERLRRGVS